jgi:hypothetical protein
MTDGISRVDHIPPVVHCVSCHARVPPVYGRVCGRCGIVLCHWCHGTRCRLCGWNWAPPQQAVCDGGGERGMG